MKKYFLLILFLLFFVSNQGLFAAETVSSDPFQDVEHLVFPNGLQVFFAQNQNANLVGVRLDVDVGYGVEEHSNLGVAHLLEHVLFRDKDLKDEMSYLQVITEAGGSANGTTDRLVTSYFGSIPKKNGPWLLETFGKMILKPSFRVEYVEKEKSTVEMERGRPGPLTVALGFNPADILNPRYLKVPNFWETEFQINYDLNFSLTDEQFGTRKLTAAQISSFYEDYYHPQNMRLYVTGKFDREVVLNEIKKSWVSLKVKENGKRIPLEPKPIPRLSSFKRLKENENNPSMSIGTKFWDANLEEQCVLETYVDYLGHRLMKQIRNQKGQTYYAQGGIQSFRGYGYSAVDLQSKKEFFQENLKIVREYIQNEAESGGISADQMREALKLYLDRFDLQGKEANNLMSTALTYSRIIDDFGKFNSPYGLMQTMTVEKYNSILKKYHQPSQRYEWLSEPPLFFSYDSMVFRCLITILIFFLLRRQLLKPFANDKIRWVRNVKYPPLRVLEALALVGAYFLFIHFSYVVELAFVNFNLLQSHLIFSEYFHSTLLILTAIVLAQSVLSVFPKKLMIVDQDLVIKSLSYFSKKIQIEDIASAELKRCLTFPFPLSLWLKRVQHRFYFYNVRFWQPGLVVHLKDGRSFYFGVSTPKKVHQELVHFIKEAEIQKTSARAS